MKIIIKVSFFLCVLFLQACAVLSDPYEKEFVPQVEYEQPEIKYENGSIYHIANSRNLFEDVRASRVGDTITVILQEQTAASKSASTNTTKSSTADIAAPSILGRTSTNSGTAFDITNFDSGTEFAGSGDSTQSNSLSGNITVTVMKVLPNGNLYVKGKKTLTLNQGSEHVKVAGVIRPIDISPQNTIASGQIANALITYGGKGMVASSNKSGWLTKFFNSGWWPL